MRRPIFENITKLSDLVSEIVFQDDRCLDVFISFKRINSEERKEQSDKMTHLDERTGIHGSKFVHGWARLKPEILEELQKHCCEGDLSSLKLIAWDDCIAVFGGDKLMIANPFVAQLTEIDLY